MGARAALAVILLGGLVAGLVLIRDHGLRLWTGVHIHEIRVPLISEYVFVVDAKSGLHLGLTVQFSGSEMARPCDT